MKKRIFSFLKYIIFLSIGILLLWLITKNQDIDRIILELKTANYFWIIVSIIVGVLSHLVRATRWNLLITPLGYKPKTSTTFYAVMIGYLANFVIPRIGEITRCGVVSKQDKAPINLIIGTVIVERAIDMICLLLILVAITLLQLDFVGGFIYQYLIIPLSNKFSNNQHIVLTLIISIIVFIALLIVAFRLSLPWIKKLSIFYKLKKLYVGFLSGIKSIKKVKSLKMFIFQTILLWFLYSLMVYIPFFALNETSHLTLGDAITIMAIGSLGIVAPVPGGIGAYHALVIILLVQIFHISSSVATTFAYLIHSSQMITIIIMGGFSYLMLFLINRKKPLHEKN